MRTDVRVDLPYLQAYKSRDKVFAYYRRNGLRIRIKAPGGAGLTPDDPEFLPAYQAIHDSFERGEAPEESPGTLSDLVTAFKGSPEWKALKPSTQKSYAGYLDEVKAWKGSLLVRDMPREFILKCRDKYADTPRKADYIISILRRVLQFALDRPQRFGLKHNPATEIPRIAKASPYKAWPDELLAALFGKKSPASKELQLAIKVGLNTGQRISDCIAMTWNQYRQGVVQVTQQKTETPLWIPATQELKTALQGASRGAVTILTREGGKAWDRHALAKELRAAVDKTDYKGYSFHGLRKNAANRLAEAGCSSAEIMAITGHKTLAMVQLYTAEVRQKKLAKAAILKMRPKRRNAKRT